MDAHSLEKLEFQVVREVLASCAQSGLGKDLALRIAPSRRAAQVETWMKQAEQFGRLVAERGAPPFGGIRDVRPSVQRAVPPSKLEPVAFAEIAETLRAVDSLRRHFAELPPEFDLVSKVAARLGDFRVIADRINRVIDDRGSVRDEASERLARLRRGIEETEVQTRDVFDRLLRHASVLKYLQYANATFHADRMVLPLRAEQRGRIPGIVHRSSDSGQTLFVEPAEAVELNNRRISLLQEEQEEIGRILWELTHLIHLDQKPILQTLEAVALIDLLFAKSRLCDRHQMCFPTVNAASMSLRRARNPILLFKPGAVQRSPHHDVVPIDVRLGDDFDVMVITGPNTGGKTATLKTVGLIALMAQAGLPIPAAPGSQLPVFEGLWIDVGDEQSLEQSLSTFSAHLARILDVIQRARRSTLVLLDELGAGTDPDEGAAIGRAVIEQLLGSGAMAIITTHLGALKAIAYETKRVDNASVQFDIESLRPTYELCIGEPGNSNAIAIASRLGMPRRMVETARQHLAHQHRALNRAIAGTLRAKRDAERARRDADTARQEAARATLAALDRAKALEDQTRAYEAWMDRILRLQPGERVYVKRFEKPGTVIRMRLDKKVASVNLGAMDVDVPLTELSFESPAVKPES